jgi:hypothetical protein
VRRRLYAALAAADLGRNMLVFARARGDGEPRKDEPAP